MKPKRNRIRLFHDLTLVAKMFKFMRPYWPMYSLGVLFFTLVPVIESLNNGLIMRSLTEAGLNRDMTIFYHGLKVYIGLMAAQYIAIVTQMLLYNIPKERVLMDVRRLLVLKTIRKKMDVLNRTPSGELISRLNHDA